MMDTADDVATAMQQLGYHAGWLMYGFIDEPELQRQIALFRSGKDTNPEHYRYASFRAVLAERSTIDDVTLRRYIELAATDEDEGMAQSALADLIQWHGLTEMQVEYLRKHPLFASSLFQGLADRKQLIRELRSRTLTDDLFQRCLVSNDEAVQRVLLSLPGLSKPQLEALQLQGPNRAIRNIAGSLLRSRRYRT